MTFLDLNISSIVVLLSLVFVVLGLILALTFFFKRDHALDEEERLNIDRSKLLWIGAAALGIVSLVAMKSEHYMKKGHKHAGEHHTMRRTMA